MLVKFEHNAPSKIWDLATGACTQTLHGHTNNVVTSLIKVDERTIASTSGDGTIKIWYINKSLIYELQNTNFAKIMDRKIKIARPKGLGFYFRAYP